MQQPACTRPLRGRADDADVHLCVFVYTCVHTWCIAFVCVHVRVSHVSQKCEAGCSLGWGAEEVQWCHDRWVSGVRGHPAGSVPCAQDPPGTLTGGNGLCFLLSPRPRLQHKPGLSRKPDSQNPRPPAPEGRREVRPQRALGWGLEGSPMAASPQVSASPEVSPAWPCASLADRPSLPVRMEGLCSGTRGRRRAGAHTPGHLEASGPARPGAEVWAGGKQAGAAPALAPQAPPSPPGSLTWLPGKDDQHMSLRR